EESGWRSKARRSQARSTEEACTGLVLGDGVATSRSFRTDKVTAVGCNTEARRSDSRTNELAKVVSASASILRLTYRPRMGSAGSTGAARTHTRGRVARSAISFAPRLRTIVTWTTATKAPFHFGLMLVLFVPGTPDDDEGARASSHLQETGGQVRRDLRIGQACP